MTDATKTPFQLHSSEILANLVRSRSPALHLLAAASRGARGRTRIRLGWPTGQRLTASHRQAQHRIVLSRNDRRGARCADPRSFQGFRHVGYRNGSGPLGERRAPRVNHDNSGLEHLQPAIEAGKGVILLAAHFTTLEISGRVLAQNYPAVRRRLPQESQRLHH